MKYLISILLLSLSGYVSAGNCPDGSQSPHCEYPGYIPNWDDRFNISYQMVNSETGEVRGESLTGGLDYAQAGALYAYLAQAVITFYQDIRELADNTKGIDSRLMPTPDSPMTQIISIEADLADR